MDLTVILDDLAAGRIDAAEAKRRIDALEAGAPPVPGAAEMSTEWPLTPGEDGPNAGPLTTPGYQTATPTPPTPPAPPATPTPPVPPAPPTPTPPTPLSETPGADTPPKADKINGVSKVLIKATGRKVRIVADSLVSTAAAEDVHQVKRSGSTLEIIGDKEFSGVIDAISWARSVRGLDDVKALGIGKELTVRVNPTLEVDIDLTGSSLHVTGLPHLGKVRLTAGVATIMEARVVSDLLLQAGQATISGRFTDGWSRFRCESGQIVVEAQPGSDVVIRGDAQLGRVSWEGRNVTDGEVTLGAGTAHLDVGVVVGHGVVKLPA